jgi:hypothetical protein
MQCALVLDGVIRIGDGRRDTSRSKFGGGRRETAERDQPRLKTKSPLERTNFPLPGGIMEYHNTGMGKFHCGQIMATPLSTCRRKKGRRSCRSVQDFERHSRPLCPGRCGELPAQLNPAYGANQNIRDGAVPKVGRTANANKAGPV